MKISKIKIFCQDPSATNYVDMTESQQNDFVIVSTGINNKNIKLTDKARAIVNTVIKYYETFGKDIEGIQIEELVIKMMKEKLKNVNENTKKQFVLSVRMYTTCFDKVINELLNQYYKGNTLSTFPIINCMEEGDFYGHFDYTAKDFGINYTNICKQLKYPIADNLEPKKLLREFVTNSKLAYDYIYNFSVELPKAVNLFRGIKIDKSIDFDVNKVVNNSLSSCTYDFNKACYFATQYFEKGKTASDYNMYVLDILFPPGTKMISPNICTVQNEFEIIICNRYVCEVLATAEIDYKPLEESNFTTINVIKCFAHTSPLVKEITNNLTLV